MKTIIPILAFACITMSCSNNADEQARVAQRSVDSMKSEMAKRQIVDSMNAAAAAQQSAVNNEMPAGVAAGNASGSAAAHSGSGRTHNTYTNTTNNYAAPAKGTVATTETKKKGWSAKAKGAVIGAGAGAITGAMVDGRKGEGAVVGGLIGAAAGLGTGAIIDKKQKQKEERERKEKEESSK